MSEAWTVDPDSRAQLSTDVRERSIAALARRQHGVVHHRQLIALGLSRQTIQRRVAARRLHPVHRGVYAVGHSRLTLRGRWIAAVLACSPGAALSHRDAGHLRNLRHSQNARIEVTVPAAAHPRRPGLRVHRTTLAPRTSRSSTASRSPASPARSSTSRQSSSPTSSPEPSRPPSASASWTTHRSTPSSPAIPATPAPATCAPHWPPTPKAPSPRAITRPCSCTSAPPMACRDRRPTARSRSATAPPSAPMPTGPPTASSSRSTATPGTPTGRRDVATTHVTRTSRRWG